MFKRIAAFALWYFAAVGIYFVIADLTETPRILGFLVGAGVAIFVAADPARLFWTRSEPARSSDQESELPTVTKSHGAI